MKTIIITGGTGFIGRNIAPMLKKKYNILVPSRKELNLLNEGKLACYCQKCSDRIGARIDAIVHCAFPTGYNPLDKPENLYYDTLKIFSNLRACDKFYERLIYFGSGAEYGKKRAISNIKEEEIGIVIPEDAYGLSRLKINEIARKSKNIVNLRLFGCYGPYDPPHKFITHVINCIKSNIPITIKQNATFDFLYVKDLASIVQYFIENCSTYQDYNVCTGVKITLEEIAQIAKIEFNSKVGISIIKDGWNFEYTGNNERLTMELKKFKVEKDIKFTSIEQGIRDMILMLNMGASSNYGDANS